MKHRLLAAQSLVLLVLLCTTSPALADRSVQSLRGEWLFQLASESRSWRVVTLPASFEQHEGTDFDGIGVYRKQIPHFELASGSRAILHFQAVATLAEVSFNGQQVGTHLGGWTPFRIDVTPQIRSAPAGAAHELLVRVDEKVGHNSQGFLPVFAPHFGGIWQDVKLLIVPDTWIDDLSVLVHGNSETGSLHVQVPLCGPDTVSELNVAVRYREFGGQRWSQMTMVQPTAVQPNTSADGSLSHRSQGAITELRCDIPISDWKSWSPGNPNLYEVAIQLLGGSRDEPVVLDRVITRGAFRSLKVDGRRILLNGKPIVVRGLLNWGYAPPRVAPSVDEKHFLSELKLARSHGFNLMKFCLWVPPKRYLELADEMGMLTWMEYPTWHSQWTPDQLPTLEQEFTEFFRHDRNHPSVVLRSLTCETGPSADLGVIRTLYDRCHAMIPESIVEDDSSWISWNRVHDFYDDHPYGNNHTWVATLDRLKQHIADRTVKPLVLGEAIAADTWADREQLLERVQENRPFWLPRFFDGNKQWTDRVRQVAGPGGLEALGPESKHYALLMRKYQIEAYRREVPFGGYVVSVIRDIPLCSMGLIDFLGQAKWSTDDWDWHGDTMLLLKTRSDRRSFFSEESLRGELALSHFDRFAIRDATLEVTIHAVGPANIKTVAKKKISVAARGLHRLEPLEIQLPTVSEPVRFTLAARLEADNHSCVNRWPMWIVPKPGPAASTVAQLHTSCSPGIQALFPTARHPKNFAKEQVVIAARLDTSLLELAAAGGRILLLPDGQKASFPLSNEWFLRGAPYIADHPVIEKVPRQLLVELQHFDLAGPVVPDIKYLDQIDPVLMLWNNHDLDHVKTHGLVFETQLGHGRLLVSALRHTHESNAAGQWLARVLADHLTSGPMPRHAMDETTIEFMKAKINEQRIDLTRQSWLFRPDPDNQGLQRQWHLPSYTPNDSWKPISIGRAWEGLGYPTLDGWAWYRTILIVPKSWQAQHIYVSFEGVDDYYELFVNGYKIGSGGDIPTRTTAFEERKSHDATQHAQPGQSVTIAVRVYDWHGAGGLFRPVTLSTAPFSNGVEVLK